MAKATTSHMPANRPEAKFGPFPGGISIAVWVNEVQTNGGRRPMRSITVSPRRYRDAQSGEWKDAPSYRPSDIPALVFGLKKGWRVEGRGLRVAEQQPSAAGGVPFPADGSPQHAGRPDDGRLARQPRN